MSNRKLNIVEKFKKVSIVNKLLLTIGTLTLFFTVAFKIYDLNLWAKPQYDCVFEKTLSIGQNWGEIQLWQNIQIKNIGDSTGVFRNIVGYIESDDQKTISYKKNIRMYNYFFDGKNYRFFPQTLNPGNWIQIQIVMYDDFSDSTYNYINRLSDTISKQKRSPKFHYSLSPQTDSILRKFVNKSIDSIKRGDYKYVVQVLDNSNRVIHSEYYKFKITQTHVWQLHNLTENIYDSYGSSSRPVVFVHLECIRDKEIQDYLNKQIPLKSYQ